MGEHADERSTSHREFERIAWERVRAAGVAEIEIRALLERATQLVEGLAALAWLDPELPEPALIWQPISDVPT